MTPARSRIAWEFDADINGIRGRVIGAQTGAPIANARIRVDPGGRTVFSDTSGRFAATLPGGARVLDVRALGFLPARDTIMDGLQVVVVLARPGPDLIGCS